MTRIAVITVGGTIAMQDSGGGATPALGPEALVAALGINGANLTTDIELDLHSFANVPSGHLTIDDIYGLARMVADKTANGADGVVITHGTDTIEETGFLLSLMCCGPVVLTGAMRAASSLSSDGPANLRDAILTASVGSRDGRDGVMVAMNGVIHGAWNVTKAHTSAVNAFQSRNGGPLGAVSEGRVDWYSIAQRHHDLLPIPMKSIARVPVLKTYLGDDGQVLRALGHAVDGLVIEAMGGGHVPLSLIDDLTALAKRCPVILATRCGDGSVLTKSYGYPGSEKDMITRGLIPAGSLSAIKARLAVIAFLDNKAATLDIQKFFSS